MIRPALPRPSAHDATVRGFTLVELMIVVAIVGVLAAIAVHGVRKYTASAKAAEARNTIGQIAKNAATAFAKDKMDPALLGGGSSVIRANELCESATPVPEQLSSVSSAKYQSHSEEWGQGSATAGWKCLLFSLDEPQYFQYDYQSEDTTAGFVATGKGDLDGDGEPSSFTLRGVVDNGVVRISPSIEEANPDE